MRLKDLTGQTFGRLKVIRRLSNVGKHVMWECLCTCGNSSSVASTNLARGKTVSCGCYKYEARRTHGKYATNVYHVWEAMITRCTSTNHKLAHRYSERGIRVCERWRLFENFYEDMGEPPQGYTLERINNDLGYSPENCKWASRKEQARNKSNNKLITYKGETKCLSDWAEEYGLRMSVLNRRIYKWNWPVEQALTAPVRKGTARKHQEALLGIKQKEAA